MKKFVICNAKGGVSKTTTAAAIASGTALRKKKTLAIDLDPQASLTYIMGGSDRHAGSYELLTGKVQASEAIQATQQGQLISSSLQLTSAANVSTLALKGAIQPLEKSFDIMVFDTSPTFSTMLLNALAAATDVIIPVNADILNIQGLVSLLQTISKVQKAYNKNLNVAGVLLTQFAPRTILARDIASTIRTRCADIGINVFDTVIRSSTAVKEAQYYKQSIFEYAPQSKPTADYLSLLDELKI